MRCARLGPSTYSMTRSTAPSCSIASKTFTTFGWLSDAATRISRRKRGATSAPESGCRRLIATRRPSSTSSARNTDAIAPAPSRRIIRKRPATSRESVDTVSICPLPPARSPRDDEALERRAQRRGDLDGAARLAVDEDVDEPARRRRARRGRRRRGRSRSARSSARGGRRAAPPRRSRGTRAARGTRSATRRTGRSRRRDGCRGRPPR